MTGQSHALRAFYAAREFLWTHREDYGTACRDFRWPEIDEFNWALDHFDAVAADPERGARRALWIVEPDGSDAQWTFTELSERKRIRRLEFAALPKTISGKIRRVELRDREGELHADPSATPVGEFTF